jgi:uncharacterized cupin superfamily protein
VVEEARFEKVRDAGVMPATEGWFVLNARDAVWVANERFGDSCELEAWEGLTGWDVGFKLRVLQPGQPNGLYHRETNQEDFLVLEGECLLLIEGEERRLRAWDFVHCPAETEHIFVGAGDGPCVILMVGGRFHEEKLFYPRSEVALRHAAGVETETPSADEAYAPFPKWDLGTAPTLSWEDAR